VLDELSSTRERDPSPQPPGRSAWLRRLLATLVVVAVGALTAANLLGEGDKPERPPLRPTASPQPSTQITPTSQPLSALRWTVRGDLADDADFTGAALDVARRNDPGAEKVLYAATLPDRSRLAFVATGYGDAPGLGFQSAGVTALHVPPGSLPAAGHVSFAGEVTHPDALVGWAGRSRSGEVYVVLLGRPAPLAARLSSAIDYTSDGAARRGWQPVRGRDGSAIVELGKETDPLVVAWTTYGDDSSPLLMSVGGDITPRARNDVAASLRIDGLDGSYRGPNRTELRHAVVDGSWAVVDPRRTDIRVLWSGVVEGASRGALLLLRRPDGPTFQVFVQGEGGAVSAQGIRHLPWADADVTPWIIQTGQPGAPLRVVNPSGAGTATIDPAGGENPWRLRIGRSGIADLGNDPALVSQLQPGAHITVLSPSGRTVVETDWTSENDLDPYVLDSL
jgi:hypothetical protein